MTKLKIRGHFLYVQFFVHPFYQQYLLVDRNYRETKLHMKIIKNHTNWIF
jgi:hypothetical protein